MQYNQGDVVLLPFPFTDQQGSKVRPGIVVSKSYFEGHYYCSAYYSKSSQ